MSKVTSGPTPQGDPSEERAAIASLMDDVLPALIARLRNSALGELEVSTDGWRVRLRREVSARSAAPVMDRVAAPDPGAAAPLGSAPRMEVARAPAVGYFAPGRDLAVGRPVRRGDSLGTVDVLGIVQEVTAPSDGVVSRLLAETGEAVEYGQALADIDPMGADVPTERDTVAD